MFRLLACLSVFLLSTAFSAGVQAEELFLSLIHI